MACSSHQRPLAWTAGGTAAPRKCLYLAVRGGQLSEGRKEGDFGMLLVGFTPIISAISDQPIFDIFLNALKPPIQTTGVPKTDACSMYLSAPQGGDIQSVIYGGRAGTNKPA